MKFRDFFARAMDSIDLRFLIWKAAIDFPIVFRFTCAKNSLPVESIGYIQVDIQVYD